MLCADNWGGVGGHTHASECHGNQERQESGILHWQVGKAEGQRRGAGNDQRAPEEDSGGGHHQCPVSSSWGGWTPLGLGVVAAAGRRRQAADLNWPAAGLQLFSHTGLDDVTIYCSGFSMLN